MIGPAPLRGRAIETRLVIASIAALVVDVVGTIPLGFGVQAMRYRYEASRLGLVSPSPNKTAVRAMNRCKAIEAYTKAAYVYTLSFGA